MCRVFWDTFSTAITGLAKKHIQALADPLPDTHPRPGRPRTLGPAEQIALACASLRTNLTQRQIAALAGVSQSTAQRAIATGMSVIDRAITLPGLTPGSLAIVDGTLIPAHDRDHGAKSKNYRNSVNTQIVIDADTRVIRHVSPTVSGNRNDITAYRATIDAWVSGQPDCPILGDGAYSSLDRITTPRRDSSNRTIKDDQWRAHRKTRARVEHVLARLKDWQMMRQIRRKGAEAIDPCIRVAAKLYNLRLSLQL